MGNVNQNYWRYYNDAWRRQRTCHASVCCACTAYYPPIAQHKEGVLEKAYEIKSKLENVCRVKIDDSDNSAGWKFAEYEMKGVHSVWK